MSISNPGSDDEMQACTHACQVTKPRVVTSQSRVIEVKRPFGRRLNHLHLFRQASSHPKRGGMPRERHRPERQTGAKRLQTSWVAFFWTSMSSSTSTFCQRIP
ncbi:unnamed protein product [Protopolystoma xenopodis]|uniref:Uncharacterized protein n=1 Tax=Protopolystoma xenopodis TaxID=117903 RepID=A0A3S5CRW0_9PLAT|nr:unnamed protein product [Protopolystoma xenopodis]